MNATIRYFNPETQQWEVSGASDAANITLKNEWLLDKDTLAVSVERGFLKLNNRLSKLEHNLAWIYLNGAKGGSGGGSGGSGSEYSIKITGDKTTFYTSTNSITINMTVNTGNTKKTVYVNAVNMANGRFLVNGEAHQSKSPFDFTIPNLPSSSNSIYIQAYDSQDNYTDVVEITVNIGSIDITLSSDPGNSYVVGEGGDCQASYSILNKTGAVAYLLTYRTREQDPLGNALATGGSEANSWGADFVNTVISSSAAGTHNVNFTSVLNSLNIGTTATFKTVLYSPSLGYLSNYFTNLITITSGDSLVAILYNLGETPEEGDTIEFMLNNFVNFGSLLYYDQVDIRTFYFRYKVYKENLLIYESNIFTREAATSGSTPTSCPTQDFEIGTGYRLEFEACATEDFSQADPKKYSKAIGYFSIKEGDNSALRDYPGRLLAAFGAFNRTSDQSTSWDYVIPDSGQYYFNEWPASVSNKTTLKLHNTTVSTGVQSDLTLYMDLSGSTYATIDRFELLFPRRTTITSSLMYTGFYMQVTYKYLNDNPIDLTILSLGEYLNGLLFKGFEINSDYIKLAFGSSQGIQLDTPTKGENAYPTGSTKKTETVTIGLNVWHDNIRTAANTTLSTYYFAVYIDGVMTKCIMLPESVLTSENSGWLFAAPLYLGCRSDLTNQANCIIYDYKLYASNQPDLAIVWNYMSAVEQAHVIKDLSGSIVVDPDLDANLRDKNLFNKNSNTCLLCGDDGEYLDPATMYARITLYYDLYEISYPIIYLEETSPQSDMYQCVKATWNPSDTIGGVGITKKKWNVNATITTKYGSLEISSSGYDELNGSHSPLVAIQGTSSLSYNSKNLEFYLGYTDTNAERLLKVNGWLPENEFTLKADVVDSAHVNNVAIGNFVNNSGYVPHYEGSGYNASDNIRKKIKNTSEGFPCLVFVKYSDGSVADGVTTSYDEDGNAISTGKTEFMGVYNFNLGRYAFHNLGLKTLVSYEQDEEAADDKPQVIEEYVSVSSPNVYSMEVADNFSNTEELFTQADLSISRYILECRYTGTTEEDAYQAITGTPTNPGLFVALARGSTEAAYPRKYRTDDGAYQDVKDDSGNTLLWASETSSIEEAAMEPYVSFEVLRKYIVLALVFGMVDSTCKNMVLRSWNGVRWFACFYDMDTAFKMDNGGADSVLYDVHFHRFYNDLVRYSDSGDSFVTGINLFPPPNHPYSDWQYAYAGMASTDNKPNRIWSIVHSRDAIALNTNKNSVNTVPGQYWELRNQYIKDADKFIDEYFAGYINKTGAILYNYDYRLKYVSYSQKWVDGLGLVSNTSSAQTTFLYGTRIPTVRTWFKKRINFLDSVYASFSDNSLLSGTYITETWTGRQRANSSVTTLTIAADLKCKIGCGTSSNEFRYIWVDETPRNYTIETQTQGNNWALKGSRIVTQLPNFNIMKWTTLNDSLTYPLLRGLNLSDCSVTDLNGIGDLYANGEGLANVRVINMNNFLLSNTSATLGLASCNTLKELYLGGTCTLSSFTLPSSGTLEILDLSDNKNITSIPTLRVNGVLLSCLVGQSGLKVLNLGGTGITDLSGNLGLTGLPALLQLTLPSTLTKLSVTNCGLTELICNWGDRSKLSPLQQITVTECYLLERLSLSGQNNLTTINISRCPNLKSINLSGVVLSGAQIINIDFSTLTQLEELIINDTAIFTSLDLSNCPNLQNLLCTNCGKLVSVICCNDVNNPIELQSQAFAGCVNLERLEGRFQVNGNRTFESCKNLNFDKALGDETLVLEMNTSNTSYMFYECKLISLASVILNKILYGIKDGVLTNASHMFESSGASFEISNTQVIFPKNKFENLLDISYMFYGTEVYGSLFSEVNTEDEFIPGFFSYLPRLTTINHAFANTRITYIDNDLFHWDMDNIVLMDNFLASTPVVAITKCVAGKSDLTPKPLSSKDFFKNISSKIGDTRGASTQTNTGSIPNNDWIWPYGIFTDTGIEMLVDLDDNGEPLLFLTSIDQFKDISMYLSNNLYTGIKFICPPTLDCSKIFKPGTRTVGGDTYYIPKFVRITSPFLNTLGMKINLESSNGFFPPHIVSLYSPFLDTELSNTTTIPVNVFKGCSKLVTAHNVFADLPLDNGNEVFKFRDGTVGMFDDCTSLLDITGLFQQLPKFLMELLSDMFINCPLVNVTNAFAYSKVIGSLPPRLFKTLNNTVKTMNGVLEGCYGLGYKAGVTYQEVSTGETTKSTWYDRVMVGTEIDYVIPNDLFWYCAKDPAIGDVLGSLFYTKTELVESDMYYSVAEQQDSKGNVIWHGPKCKIPADLFNGEEISKSTMLTNVFSNTRFLPYTNDDLIGDNVNYQRRGPLYPPKLFKYVPDLANASGMFQGTIIYSHNYINDDIFLREDGSYLPITNLSYCWYDCLFEPYVIQELDITSDPGHSLLGADGTGRFLNNLQTITDISHIFAGVPANGTGLKWTAPLNIPQVQLFDFTLQGILKIEGALSNAPLMATKRGVYPTVPTFPQVAYVTGGKSYLIGITEYLVANALTIKDNYTNTLCPDAWLLTDEEIGLVSM